MYFFDLDGTLLDSNGIWMDIDVAFLAQLGISPVPEDYTDYVTHHTFQDAAVYTRDYFQLSLTPQEIINTWQDMAQQAYASQLQLKPGAKRFLTRAKQAGKRCVLLTSCMPNLCRAALQCHQLEAMFTHVLTTFELGLEKADPQLYHTLAQQFGLDGDACILFDDSPVYCAAAKQAGWQVYAMADPVFAHRAEELAELCGPDRFPFSFFAPLP